MLFCWYAIPQRSVEGSDLWLWVLSVVEYWAIWFASPLLLDFNPFPQSVIKNGWLNRAIACLTCGLVSTRVGKWHIERKMVKSYVCELALLYCLK